MKKLILAAALAASSAAPAFAQSFDPDFGTGNVIASTSANQQTNTSSTRQSGLNAFAMDSQSHAVAGSSDPASTGGGSEGYNQNLYNY